MTTGQNPTGYEPLFTLKPVAPDILPDIWVVDGPIIKFYGMPFPTRMVVIRLPDGGLWLHSPIALDADLLRTLADLGPVQHLVAPNWIHYAYLPAWQGAFPEALTWAAPGVRDRAKTRGIDVRIDSDLGEEAPPMWAGVMDQLIIPGSPVHREAVFFHRPSRTLILTDLIENFEAANLPVWCIPLAWAAGILDPDGKAPIDMRQTFRKGRLEARAAIQTMLDWQPERLIMAHGRWYPTGAMAELNRAFRWVLD